MARNSSIAGNLRIPTLTLLVSGFAALVYAEVALRFVPPSEEGGGYVELTGLQAGHVAALRRTELANSDWRTILPVRTASDATGSAPPAMLGSYEVVDGAIRFVPRFGWSPGMSFRAQLMAKELESQTSLVLPEASFEFTAPVPPRPAPASVAAVYPSGETLPENHLRFYLHFTAPMQQGDSYRHIHLLDDQGQTIADPFLELGEEMWDRSGTRLTLLIDPGRIKRGLKPREDVGPVFEAGKEYTLVIDTTWRDVHRRPLADEYRKTYRVVEPDETQPDIDQWTMEVPPAGDRDPLTVVLDDPLDHAMLERVVRVTCDNADIAGAVHVGEHETVWQFRPDRPWQPGTYRLVADADLEDSAGNSLGRPFEVDMQQPDAATNQQQTFVREFVVE